MANEFHDRIRNLNSCFALASFTVDENRTISNSGVYSFIAGGQIYHKINLAAHPTQVQGVTAQPNFGQLYFLDSEEAVSERIEFHDRLNRTITEPLLQLLEDMIRKENHL